MSLESLTLRVGARGRAMRADRLGEGWRDGRIHVHQEERYISER